MIVTQVNDLHCSCIGDHRENCERKRENLKFPRNVGNISVIKNPVKSNKLCCAGCWLTLSYQTIHFVFDIDCGGGPGGSPSSASQYNVFVSHMND